MDLNKCDIADIGNSSELIRYAARGQLELLLASEEARALGLTQADVAKAIGVQETRLSKMLSGDEQFTILALQGLDAVTVALAPKLDHCGGLDLLAMRLKGMGRRIA